MTAGTPQSSPITRNALDSTSSSCSLSLSAATMQSECLSRSLMASRSKIVSCLWSDVTERSLYETNPSKRRIVTGGLASAICRMRYMDATITAQPAPTYQRRGVSLFIFLTERPVGLPFRKQIDSGASITRLIVECKDKIFATIVCHAVENDASCGSPSPISNPHVLPRALAAPENPISRNIQLASLHITSDAFPATIMRYI
jgi:hypothetical protein